MQIFGCGLFWEGKEVGTLGRTSGIEKSFISLFIMTPVAGTMSWEPNRRLMVLVMLIASPLASAAATCEVPLLPPYKYVHHHLKNGDLLVYPNQPRRSVVGHIQGCNI